MLISKFTKQITISFSFLLIALVPSLPMAQDQINRGEFVKIFSDSQPTNPFLPKGHKQLSKDQLYSETVKKLNERGIKVLNGKKPNEPMSNLEFVRVSYALSGAPLGKSLYEQKKYLKEKGLLETADIGLTTGVDGQAFLFHKGDRAAYKVQLASPVYMNDKVETEEEANISFTFDDQSTLTLGEDAQVRITKHVYNPDNGLRQTVVNVTSGMVRFVVSKAKGKGSMFKVVTPTATAGVLGTEFVTVVEPDGQTQFVGIENQIEVTPILPDGTEGVKQIVAAGQMRSIAQNGIATAVTQAPPGLINSFKAQTSTPQKVNPNQPITPQKAQSAAKSNWITQAALTNVNDAANQGAANGLGATKSAAAAANAGKGLKKAASVIGGNPGKGSGKIAGLGNPGKGAAKGAAQAAKGAAKNAAKSAAKNAAKASAKTVAKRAAKGVAKTAAKSAAKGAAKKATDKIAKKASKRAIRTAAAAAAAEATAEAAQEAATTVASQVARENVTVFAQAVAAEISNANGNSNGNSSNSSSSSSSSSSNGNKNGNSNNSSDSDDSPGNSENAPGQSNESPGNSENAPGQSNDPPGQSSSSNNGNKNGKS